MHRIIIGLFGVGSNRIHEKILFVHLHQSFEEGKNISNSPGHYVTNENRAIVFHFTWAVVYCTCYCHLVMYFQNEL